MGPKTRPTRHHKSSLVGTDPLLHSLAPSHFVELMPASPGTSRTPSRFFLACTSQASSAGNSNSLEHPILQNRLSKTVTRASSAGNSTSLEHLN